MPQSVNTVPWQHIHNDSIQRTWPTLLAEIIEEKRSPAAMKPSKECTEIYGYTHWFTDHCDPVSMYKCFTFYKHQLSI